MMLMCAHTIILEYFLDLYIYYAIMQTVQCITAALLITTDMKAFTVKLCMYYLYLCRRILRIAIFWKEPTHVIDFLNYNYEKRPEHTVSRGWKLTTFLYYILDNKSVTCVGSFLILITNVNSLLLIVCIQS